MTVIIRYGTSNDDTNDIDQLVKDLVEDARETIEADESGLDQAEGSSKAPTPGKGFLFAQQPILTKLS